MTKQKKITINIIIRNRYKLPNKYIINLTRKKIDVSMMNEKHIIELKKNVNDNNNAIITIIIVLLLVIVNIMYEPGMR